MDKLVRQCHIATGKNHTNTGSKETETVTSQTEGNTLPRFRLNLWASKLSKTWKDEIMSVVTFDTLEFVETLKQAGIPENQARAQSEALKKVLHAEVATKQDMENMELKIKADIETAKSEIIKWNTGTLLVATGIFVAISKFLH